MKTSLHTCLRAVGGVVVFCGIALLCGVLVWVLFRVAHTPGVSESRAEERLTTLTNVNEASRQILDYYAWQDTDKGFVRLPIERAKVLTVEEWSNPEAARSNLMARAAVLLAVPPAPMTNGM